MFEHIWTLGHIIPLNASEHLHISEQCIRKLGSLHKLDSEVVPIVISANNARLHWNVCKFNMMIDAICMCFYFALQWEILKRNHVFCRIFKF